MTTSSTIIADSISPDGIRITTHEVCFHRFILPEVNTHRVLTKSFRSSRAVPVGKLLREVRENPAYPSIWQLNQKGMQGGAEMTDYQAQLCRTAWEDAAYNAADSAEKLMSMGLHKSWSNRMLEPFLWARGVITATEWDNLFKLRIHSDAQPEFKLLAEAMRDAMADSQPVLLEPGQWHTPYVRPEDSDAVSIWCHKSRDYDIYLPLISAARCARSSYTAFDGTTSVEADLKLAEKLKTDGHWSPFEHQATPDTLHHGGAYPPTWRCPEQHRNFRGWRQHRALLDM